MTSFHRLRRAARRVLTPAKGDQPEPAVATGLSELAFNIPDHLAHPPADLITIGEHTYGNPKVAWFAGDTARFRVGRYSCLHDTAVIFVGGEHRGDWVTTSPIRELFGLPGRYESGIPFTRGDVTFGNDVYLGYEAFVRSGVTIGDGAIVAARSVVTKDVEPFAVVAGNPARLVKYRFDEETRQALTRIRWWDWPDEKVIANVELLSSPDLARFVAVHDPGMSDDD